MEKSIGEIVSRLRRHCDQDDARHDGSLLKGFVPSVATNDLRALLNLCGNDLVALVIAGREAFDTGCLPDDEERALDTALERFAALVPYADEPTLKDTPAS